MRSFRLQFSLAAILCLIPLTSTGTGARAAYFVGRVVAEWLSDGREMKLLEPFAFVDPFGTRWDAPQGSIVDGASIPKFAWSIIGGPFEGKYRDASVIHDVACVAKVRPWKDVHRTFYYGMQASGVDAITAKIMYAAVYHFGPRWGRELTYAVPKKEVVDFRARLSESAPKDETLKLGTGVLLGVECVSCPHVDVEIVTATYTPTQGQLSASDFESLEKIIESRNPSLDEIDAYIPAKNEIPVGGE